MIHEQKQVLISGLLGDGSLKISTTKKARMHFSGMHEEYITYKNKILSNMAGIISKTINRGYKEGVIYQFSTLVSEELNKFCNDSLLHLISNIDELGLALWIYDDGSLHKNKHYYNINTQAYTKDFQEIVLIPLLKNRFNITANLRKETKKDGRIFYYLQVSKYKGAYIITKILEKYPFKCFKYKRWSSETIHLWSKFQEELKSIQVNNKNLTSKQLGAIYRKVNLRYSPNYEETHRYVVESTT
jgi:LAGLIDADG DNA endonuclease family.